MYPLSSVCLMDIASSWYPISITLVHKVSPAEFILTHNRSETVSPGLSANPANTKQESLVAVRHQNVPSLLPKVLLHKTEPEVSIFEANARLSFSPAIIKL